MNEYRQIKDMGADLSTGESLRSICPFCGGGRSREDSFRVLREGPATLRYDCFRATCGAWGYVGVAPRGPEQPEKHPKRLITYDKEIVALPRSTWQFAPISKTGKTLADYLSYEECTEQGFTYGPEDARVLMPILDYRGYCIGCIARGVGGQRDPRNLTFREHDAEWFHFPKQNLEGDHVTIVEDVISSIVVARVAPCASTLGTRFTKSMAEQLRRLRIGSVSFCYDGDVAGYESAQHAVRAAGGFGLQAKIIPCPLGSDPKDLDIFQLEKLLYG